MWMPICPLYTPCKYFFILIKIEHFRAKHGISKFCKQTPLNEQMNSMCNKTNIHEILLNKWFHFMFHTCDLVQILLMENTPCKLFNILNILILFRMFKKMITISENATPKNLYEDESSVQLWEARVPGISFYKWSAAQTWSVQMLECHKRRSTSQTTIKHLTPYLPFGCTHVKQELTPNPIPNFIQGTITTIFSENTKQIHL